MSNPGLNTKAFIKEIKVINPNVKLLDFGIFEIDV
jgi:hypothetical protein